MAISYNRLWKLLIDRNMNKSDLVRVAGISAFTVSKMGKDQSVTLNILEKICLSLQCDIGDIVCFVPDTNDMP